MYQRDYILRLIEQTGAALRRLLSEIREHRPDDALEAADEVVAAALGAPAVLAYSLTVDGLVTMLSPGGSLDVERAVLVAEALDARSRALDAAGRPREARDLVARCGALRIAATVSAGEDRVAEVRALLRTAAEGRSDALASEGDAP